MLNQSSLFHKGRKWKGRKWKERKWKTLIGTFSYALRVTRYAKVCAPRFTIAKMNDIIYLI